MLRCPNSQSRFSKLVIFTWKWLLLLESYSSQQWKHTWLLRHLDFISRKYYQCCQIFQNWCSLKHYLHIIKLNWAIWLVQVLHKFWIYDDSIGRWIEHFQFLLKNFFVFAFFISCQAKFDFFGLKLGKHKN